MVSNVKKLAWPQFLINPFKPDISVWFLYIAFFNVSPLYIYIYMNWVQVTPDVILSNVTPLNIF